MKLHTDPDGFTALLNLISGSTGIRPDILEKDYYITLLTILRSWRGLM